MVTRIFFAPHTSVYFEQLGHITLATARLRFLFLAARIWRHAGTVGVSYSDHYPEQSLFERLMARLRAVTAQSRWSLRR